MSCSSRSHIAPSGAHQDPIVTLPTGSHCSEPSAAILAEAAPGTKPQSPAVIQQPSSIPRIPWENLENHRKTIGKHAGKWENHRKIMI